MKTTIYLSVVVCLCLFVMGCPNVAETSATQVTYSGDITLPADVSGMDTDWYVRVENAAVATAVQVLVTFGDSNGSCSGSFSIEDTSGGFEGSRSYVYLYSDVDGNGEMSFLIDRAVFLLVQNNNYPNDAIDVHIVKISGSLADTTENAYGLAESGSEKLLRVGNQTYWVTTYQPLPIGGDFEVLAVMGHTIDLSLLKETTESAAVDVVEEKYFGDRVRLFTPYTFSSDATIHSPDDPNQPLNIRTITLTCMIEKDGYGDYPLYIRAGQDPMVIPATDSNGEQLSGSKTAAGLTLTFFFRDFDRTTDTGGALPDSSRTDTTTGYGAFFQASVFIDINRDEMYNPDEPVSGIYYLGDSNGNGVPDWGETETAGSGDGDYNDEQSFSGIDGDLLIDGLDIL